MVLFLSPPRRGDGSRTLFNNATFTLASYLRRRGVEARIQPLIGPNWIEHLVQALQERPEFAAISCKWWDTLYGATEVARLVKAFSPSTRTVLGGQTATAFAEELVGRAPVDAVVRGDGERPLYELVTGQPTCNLTTREGTLPQSYVQQSEDGEDLRLFELESLASPAFLEFALQDPFVWTGKGCKATCLFCAGSALGHKRLFGRKGYMYRPIEHVLHDMKLMEPYCGGRYMFDYDPVADPGRGGYYQELFSALEPKRYHVAFYSWSLPEPDFLELIVKTFRSAVVSIDAQTYSEPLRRRLAEKRMIKPFTPNAAIEEALQYLQSHPNIGVSVYGILGLSGESPEDVGLAEGWIDRLLSGLRHDMGEVHLTPLSIEPGSLVDRDPEKYSMVALRRGYQDYLKFTGLAWKGSGGFHEAAYDAALPHPYGLYQQGQRPDRVYSDFSRIKARLESFYAQRRHRRALEAISFGPDEVRLTLRSESMFEDYWKNLTWAAGIALDRGLRRLRVDAREGFAWVPSAGALELSGQHEYVALRMPAVREAMERGALEVDIETGPGQSWGFWQEAGARLH